MLGNREGVSYIMKNAGKELPEAPRPGLDFALEAKSKKIQGNLCNRRFRKGDLQRKINK